MLLDLKFSIGTLGLATGTLFSALYGMNLKNFIEESDLGFGLVSIACVAISGIVCVYCLAKLRKVQRVRMWGEAGVGGAAAIAPIPGKNAPAAIGTRANWRSDSIEPMLSALPGEGRVERMKRLKEGAAAAAVSSAAAPGAEARRAAMAKSVVRPSSESQTDGSMFVKQGISQKESRAEASG